MITWMSHHLPRRPASLTNTRRRKGIHNYYYYAVCLPSNSLCQHTHTHPGPKSIKKCLHHRPVQLKWASRINAFQSLLLNITHLNLVIERIHVRITPEQPPSGQTPTFPPHRSSNLNKITLFAIEDFDMVNTPLRSQPQFPPTFRLPVTSLTPVLRTITLTCP